LREIETDEQIRKSPATFQSVVDDINSLLPLIRLVRRGNAFEIEQKANNAKIAPDGDRSTPRIYLSLCCRAACAKTNKNLAATDRRGP
jgi:hypothetical protein